MLGANGAQAAGERWPDGARYDLALAFDAGRRALTGTEDVSFANTGPAPLERVWLRVWASGRVQPLGPFAHTRSQTRSSGAGPVLTNETSSVPVSARRLSLIHI